ncbi:MAG: class I tRNA ligase family protein [Deltaproteobacteria bacterium]|nr:class I tRNA ligase family protein [Deltaproteobacteria bacterium]
MRDNSRVCLRCGSEVAVRGVEKMSKSKKNIVDPDNIIEKYGADTTRLFSLFAAPPEKDLDWSEEGVEGSFRFLSRVWRLVTENMCFIEGVLPYNGDELLQGVLKETHYLVHRTIERVTADIGERFHFNTAISKIMELVNSLYQWPTGQDDLTGLEKKVFREAVEAVVLLLSPFAPHICEELWKRLGNTRAVFETAWPKMRGSALCLDEAMLVVQVNGRVRARVNVPAGSDQKTVEGIVMKDEKVIEWIRGKDLKNLIYVPDRLINLVVG